MRGAWRMDGERARVADIGNVIKQLERVDELLARVDAALEFEADQPAIAALQISVGATLGLAALLRRVVDLDDLGVLLEEIDHRLRVLAVLADAQRQRFQPLNMQ